jgi:transcriptional regulator with XRE-family HTH domain
MQAATGVTEIRHRQRMSISRLAAKAGVSRVTVYAVERGESVSLETLVSIAAALGVPLSEIAPGAAERLEGVAS